MGQPLPMDRETIEVYKHTLCCSMCQPLFWGFYLCINVYSKEMEARNQFCEAECTLCKIWHVLEMHHSNEVALCKI